ncbi:MAG: helix-turn-helix domain-containing protein [Ignavibacteria bacterium]|nr:helix-turn-helix domain-containing protein [Ignavibacteria bacterium]
MDILTYKEFGTVLNLAGFSHREFADYIQMSRSFVGSLVRGERPLSLRYIDSLRSFLGKELYDVGLTLARRKIAEEERRLEERRQKRIDADREKAEAQEHAARERREKRTRLLSSATKK